MAITIENNLYPPIFESSYAPAFLYIESCKIYFSISDFNSADDLHQIYPLQISIRHQSTNQTALNQYLYPSEIKLSNYLIDQKGYYFQINPNDIQGGFNLNEYYKVQIRFTGAAAASPSNPNSGLNSWISENLSYFSEWSTVLLIYGISQPIIELKNFQTGPVNVFDNINIPVVGSVSFSSPRDKETVKSYQITVYEENTLLQDSGIIYIDSYNPSNEINYLFSYNFQYDTIYNMKIIITTKNLYQFTTDYLFKVVQSQREDFKVDLSIQPIEESGSFKIVLKSRQPFMETNYVYDNTQDLLTGTSIVLNITEPLGTFGAAYYISNNAQLLLYNGVSPIDDLSSGTKIILRRASSKTCFKEWEEISTFIIQNNLLSELILFDCTVEPGVWYKYQIVRYKTVDQALLISSIVSEKPYMVYTEDIFLTANNKQLKVRYNPQISNFSVKTSETLTETIGSKFPYIRRNGNVYYRTFSLSGTITFFMNAGDNLFKASKEQIYQENDIVNLYEEYNRQNHITPYSDFIYEKQFRKKVIDFLYADDIKLFRSLTEGNLLIKLMNITLTPNRSLNRMIYDFSCTAYEIDEETYINYIKHNIAINQSKEILQS